jgi:hypothetical protein
MSPLVLRLLGLLALPAGAGAVATGIYCFVGAFHDHPSSSGTFSLLMFGGFTLGLGLPALLASLTLILRPTAAKESLVPRLPMLRAGILLLLASVALTLAPLFGATDDRPNVAGTAILGALALGFIRSGRKRDLTSRWSGP